MTPEQIAHQVAGDWIMGPINMGDLEDKIATAIRRERDAAQSEANHWEARYHSLSLISNDLALAEDALHRIVRTAETAMSAPTPQGHSYETINELLHIARRAILTIQGER